jgi:hypothetical protein
MPQETRQHARLVLDKGLEMCFRNVRHQFGIVQNIMLDGMRFLDKARIIQNVFGQFMDIQKKTRST